MQIQIGKLKLKNPVLAASGTFGCGEEFSDFFDINKLGALVTKTITLKPRAGNLPPRTCETPAGMLNSIGLENPGLEVFIKEKIPYLSKIGTPLIVSIASEGGVGEFVELVKRLDKIKKIAALELNISCPNIEEGRLIPQDPNSTFEVVRVVRKATNKTLITKLSPNIADITEIAKAAENGGSDAVSLINTFTAMSIDIKTKKPKLGNVTGGLSGPAIKPIALRMVWEVYNKIKIPIIGMGGIMNTQDALEFIIAGASAIAVGTANFVNPKVTVEIVEGIEDYLRENRIKDIKELVGSLKI